MVDKRGEMMEKIRYILKHHRTDKKDKRRSMWRKHETNIRARVWIDRNMESLKKGIDKACLKNVYKNSKISYRLLRDFAVEDNESPIITKSDKNIFDKNNTILG